MQQPDTPPASPAAAGTEAAPMKGRSVFVVEATPAGMAVRTAFLAEGGQLLEAPALFPDVGQALAEIDELRRLLLAQFSAAARVGAQVLAAQAANARQQGEPAAAASASDASEAAA